MKQDQWKKILSEGKDLIKKEKLQDYEYLIHHIEIDSGVESIHHCRLYDHIGNLYVQEHIVIEDGVAKVNGKKIKDGTFHIITGLELTQEVCWSDEEAQDADIDIKAMYDGMTKKEKAKQW